jgi:predicted nucleic acid-binding protein
MTDRSDEAALVDTNIFVYAYDRQAGVKHATAAKLIAELSDGQCLKLSAQVVNELAAVLLKRRSNPRLEVEQVIQIIEEVQTLGEVMSLTGTMSATALEGVRLHGLSFWDALIWVAAKTHGIGRIYTEDFQNGRVLEGVRFVNPFES